MKQIRGELKEEFYNELKIIFETLERDFLIGKKSTYTLSDAIEDIDKKRY